MSDAWSEAMKYTRKQTGNSWNDDIFNKQATYEREEKMTTKPLALALNKDETKLLTKCVDAYLKDLDTYGEQVEDITGHERLAQHKEFINGIKYKLKNFLSHLD